MDQWLVISSFLVWGGLKDILFFQICDPSKHVITFFVNANPSSLKPGEFEVTEIYRELEDEEMRTHEIDIFLTYFNDFI